MKLISPFLHSVIDFLVVLFLLASPLFFGLEGPVAFFTYALAMVHMLLMLLTDFNAGVVKIIPLPLHGIIELITGVTFIVLALTLFADTGTGKIFYIAFGSAVLLTWFCTDYRRELRRTAY